MITIQQMQYVIALYEEENFLKASEKCFVTQPTLSMQIKKAEESIGYPLFDRSVHPIQPTSFGKKMINQIRLILDTYDQLNVILQQEKGLYKEEVKMAIIPTVANYFIRKMYPIWLDKSNGVQLTIEEMKSEELLDSLSQGKIDIGILAGPVVDPSYRVTKLYDEEIRVYYPSQSKKILITNDLKDAHPWLLTSGNCLRTQMMHFCELENEDNEKWDYQGGNLELLLDMVDNFGGYTLVPENYKDYKDREFKQIQSETKEVPVREIIAVTRNRSPKWEIMEKLIRTVQLSFDSSKKRNKQVLSWQ